MDKLTQQNNHFIRSEQLKLGSLSVQRRGHYTKLPDFEKPDCGNKFCFLREARISHSMQCTTRGMQMYACWIKFWLKSVRQGLYCVPTDVSSCRRKHVLDARKTHVPWHTIWKLGNRTGPTGLVRGRQESLWLLSPQCETLVDSKHV